MKKVKFELVITVPNWLDEEELKFDLEFDLNKSLAKITETTAWRLDNQRTETISFKLNIIKEEKEDANS